MTSQEQRRIPQFLRPKRRRSSSFAAADGSPLERGDESAALQARAEADLLRQLPPHSLDAEKAVLGAILLTPEVLQEIAPLLQPEDFYLPAHRLIFKAFLDLSEGNAPVDGLTLKNYLQEHGLLEEAGGTLYLVDLGKTAVSSARADYHAGFVRDKAQVRNLIRVCSEIISRSFEPGLSVTELLDSSEQEILAAGERRTDHNYSSSAELAEKAFETLNQLASSGQRLTGIPTGYSRLDQLTSGLQRSDLIILAARPGMGKTALALNLLASAAFSHDDWPGVPVAIFSVEMAKEQLIQRMLCSEGRVNLSDLRGNALSEEDWAGLQKAADRLSKASIFIDDTDYLTIDALRFQARRLRRREGIELLVVDYLQLMHAPRRMNSRELEIAEISRGLKGLAKELHIPVIALSQLNRDIEKTERKNKRPMLSDLRESGAIEQDADLIMFIYRDEQNKPEDEEKHGEKSGKLGYTELIIGKHRNGRTGSITLRYIPAFTRFEEGVFGGG